MALNRWWEDDPEQRFWFENTRRTDIGADLHAPIKEDGTSYAFWDLIREPKEGDVVFHYFGEAIIGYSFIRGEFWKDEIFWDYFRPGQLRGLVGYTEFPEPIPMKGGIDLHEEEIFRIRERLEEDVGKPIYFPFQRYSGKSMRAFEGYFTKFPKEHVDLLGLDELILTESEEQGARSSLEGEIANVDKTSVRASSQMHVPVDDVKAAESTSWVNAQDGSGKWTITEEGVYEAIREFRETGRESFLSEYGFGESTLYKLLFDDEFFDPKAIVGVAHKWSGSESIPLTSEQLSGGIDRGNANWCLSQLGFQIVEIKTGVKNTGKSREIKVEESKTAEYVISPREEVVGQRKESLLQKEYEQYLESLGHETTGWALSSEDRMSYVDLIDKTANELYEVKSSAKHTYVWKAIGQVLYYARLLTHEMPVETVSILLPSRPEKELLELMHALNIVCVYKDGESFTRVEPTSGGGGIL